MKIALVTTLPSLAENKRIEQEAKALGHEFVFVGLSHFGFSVKSGKLRAEGLSDLQADRVIIRGIFSSIKVIAALAKNLHEHGVRVFDNGFCNQRYSIDKLADLAKLSLAGIPIPDTSYARDFRQYRGLARQIGYPLVLKAARMSKGVQVFKVEKEKELSQLIKDLQSWGKEAKSYILQKFVPYKYDLRVLVIGESMFAMRRRPAKGEFRANFSLGGEVEPFVLDREARELVLRAVKAIELSVGGVDILVAGDGKRYVLEVNHTPGFLGMEKATGENIGRVYLEYALENAV